MTFSYEAGFASRLVPNYVRGQAYLKARQGKEAAAEFQKILNHRGVCQTAPACALSHLQLARARAMSGDGAGARTAYQEFFAIRKDAGYSFVSNIWVPTIRGEIEINRGNPGKAIELLQMAFSYEAGFASRLVPNYVRGQAYLKARQGKEAAAEFQKILNHRGDRKSTRLNSS